MDLTILLAVIVVLVVAPLMSIPLGIPTWPWLAIIVAFILVFETTMYWLVRTQLLRDIWYSWYRTVDSGPEPFMEALEVTLREAGFADAARRATPRHPNWKTIDVGNGLNVTWMVVPGESDKLHVGPDRKDTHVQVERVKGVVDEVLQGLEREKSAS